MAQFDLRGSRYPRTWQALQVALWPKAMEGDVRAVDSILKTIDRRIRLLGLDQVPAQGEFPRTVVVDPADLVRWGIEATREATEPVGGAVAHMAAPE